MTKEQWDSLVAKDPRYAKFHPNATHQVAKVTENVAITLPLCEHLGPACEVNRRLCSIGHGGKFGVKPCCDCGQHCPDYSPDD
jgi:hypothetical protein